MQAVSETMFGGRKTRWHYDPVNGMVGIGHADRWMV